jgi:hypothetical protein
MKISVHCGGTKRQKGEFWQNYTVENFFAKQPSPFYEILAFDESIIFLCYNALRMTELRPEDGIFFQLICKKATWMFLFWIFAKNK